jgi:mRNA-degrading endonuclease toxin of MazEF toxin-antitoxin module
MPKRGEIDFGCLDPVFGREMGGFKERPLAIISIDKLNVETPPAVVVPGTSSSPSRPSPEIVAVDGSEANGLRLFDDDDKPMRTYFHCHQIRSVAQARLLKKVGYLSRADRERLEKSLRYVLGLLEE